MTTVMTMTTDTILGAIGFTEPSSFGEFCGALGADCPEKGDRDAWRELFSTLNGLAAEGLVEIERDGRNIESIVLTEAGANYIRGKKDAARPLFSKQGL